MVIFEKQAGSLRIPGRNPASVCAHLTSARDRVCRHVEQAMQAEQGRTLWSRTLAELQIPSVAYSCGSNLSTGTTRSSMEQITELRPSPDRGDLQGRVGCIASCRDVYAQKYTGGLGPTSESLRGLYSSNVAQLLRDLRVELIDVLIIHTCTKSTITYHEPAFPGTSCPCPSFSPEPLRLPEFALFSSQAVHQVGHPLT